jgi:AcrR family transcriptional regulator
MARVRSSEKRSAILEAAVHEIARSGLGASTAEIARSAGVAAGTLFTYFASTVFENAESIPELLNH